GLCFRLCHNFSFSSSAFLTGGLMMPAAGAAVTEQLQPVICDFKPRLRSDPFQKLLARSGVEVGEAAAPEAARVVVVIAADFVTRGGVAVSQLRRRAAGGERFEVFVNRREADPRQFLPDGEEDLLGRRVVVHPAQVLEDGGALPREVTALV